MEQVEKVIARLTDEFSKKPISTTIKGLIILWVLKQVKEWWDKK